MTTKQQPVGWWCELRVRRLSDYPRERCEFRNHAHNHTPVYTRTQIRNAFEGLAEWLDEHGLTKKPFLWLGKEIRCRMEEW